MNEHALLHTPGSKYCFPTGSRTVELRLRSSKQDVFERVQVVYGCKYDYYLRQKSADMRLTYTDGLFNYYTASLVLSDVRLVYVFLINEKDKDYYFSEDGLTAEYDFSLSYYNAFQLPYINDADVMRTVPWMRSAVFYEIFVDRFHRGDTTKDDGYINIKWGDIPAPDSFAGGDLKGITEKLGYISGLGVNALYLTPIFRAVSNHKYDISDYYTVDRQFGTNGDLKELVEKAHARGMKIVLDAVFNHCSENLMQFQDVLKKGRASRYHNWFIIDGDKPDREKGNYEYWGTCDYMPKFNTSEKEVQDYLIGIALHYIEEYGIDGWRLDVSDEVSHSFWRRFRRHVKGAAPDCVIIGENWHDAYPFLQGDQYDSIMNYAFTKACLDLFVYGTLDAHSFSERIEGLLMRNTDQVNVMMMNILDSHDTHRFLTQADGSTDKLLCALAVLFFFVGAPGLYYGTEIGMLGDYDPDCRRCMDWEKAAAGGEIAEVIKELCALKTADKNLHGSGFKSRGQGGLLIIDRAEGGGGVTRLIANPSEKSLPLPSGAVVFGRGIDKETLKPYGFAVVRAGGEETG